MLTTSDDTAQLASLARIDGLDAQAGLHAVRGKLATYLRLLGTFSDSHLADFARIRELLAAGDHEEARRLAHSIKGAAATLGATTVFQAAAAIDLAIRQGTPTGQVLPLIDRCETLYQRLHDDFHQQPQGSVASQPAAGSRPDAGLAREQLQPLSQQLKESDFSVLNRLQAVNSLLQQVLAQDAQAFDRHIADYDFEAAAELLDQALQRLN